jgi:hypothetical protein
MSSCAAAEKWPPMPCGVLQQASSKRRGGLRFRE